MSDVKAGLRPRQVSLTVGAPEGMRTVTADQSLAGSRQSLDRIEPYADVDKIMFSMTQSLAVWVEEMHITHGYAIGLDIQPIGALSQEANSRFGGPVTFPLHNGQIVEIGRIDIEMRGKGIAPYLFININGLPSYGDKRCQYVDHREIGRLGVIFSVRDPDKIESWTEVRQSHKVSPADKKRLYGAHSWQRTTDVDRRSFPDLVTPWVRLSLPLRPVARPAAVGSKTRARFGGFSIKAGQQPA